MQEKDTTEVNAEIAAIGIEEGKGQEPGSIGKSRAAERKAPTRMILVICPWQLQRDMLLLQRKYQRCRPC